MNESLILTNLINDAEYTAKVLNYLKPEYFYNDHIRTLYDHMIEYHKKYSEIPDQETIFHELTKTMEVEDDIDLFQVLADLTQDNEPKLEWLIDETEEFIKTRSLENAILESSMIINGKSKGKRESIPDLLKTALAISFDDTVGHDYYADAKSRYDFYKITKNRIPFSINILNVITSNGIPRKTLNVLLAPINVGKTMAMCSLAHDYIKTSKNVLYVTMEMGEEEIANRIDSNVLSTPVNEVKKVPEDDFIRRIESSSKNSGRLFVKQYPTGMASVADIELLLNDLELKKAFKPDVIFVDYIGIFTSKNVSKGEGSYTHLKAVAEELRALAVTTNTVLWSASQVTRSEFKSKDLDMSANAESIAIPATADFMLALTRTEEMDEVGEILVKQIKSRYGDKTKNERFSLRVNVDLMRLSDSVNTINISESEHTPTSMDAPPFDSGVSNSKFSEFKY